MAKRARRPQKKVIEKGPFFLRLVGTKKFVTEVEQNIREGFDDYQFIAQSFPSPRKINRVISVDKKNAFGRDSVDDYIGQCWVHTPGGSVDIMPSKKVTKPKKKPSKKRSKKTVSKKKVSKKKVSKKISKKKVSKKVKHNAEWNAGYAQGLKDGIRKERRRVQTRNRRTLHMRHGKR